jgi:hypothetical protein
MASRVSLTGRRERSGSFGVERPTIGARWGAGSAAVRLRRLSPDRATRAGDARGSYPCVAAGQRGQSASAARRRERRGNSDRKSRDIRRSGRCGPDGSQRSRQGSEARLAIANGDPAAVSVTDRVAGRAAAADEASSAAGRPGAGRSWGDRPDSKPEENACFTATASASASARK